MAPGAHGSLVCAVDYARSCWALAVLCYPPSGTSILETPWVGEGGRCVSVEEECYGASNVDVIEHLEMLESDS